jgi:hypothetical protein
MINGAESVNAMKPSFAVVTSGASSAAIGLAAGEEEDEASGAVLSEEELQLFSNQVAAVVALAVRINLRLERFDMLSNSSMNRD